ncbi:MAG: hypothetical protein ACK5JO_12545 [Halodesulfovibrio sp.]
MPRIATRLLPFLLLFALHTQAFAEKKPYSVFAKGHHIGSADVDSGDGSFETSGFTTGFSMPLLTFSYTQDTYDWNNASSLPLTSNGDDPWDTLHVLELSTSFSGKLADRWGWFAYGNVDSAFEEEMKDSFGALAVGGISYSLNERFSISAGVGGKFHSVEDELFPVLSIHYNAVGADGVGAYGSLGVDGVVAGYAFTPSLRLKGAVKHEIEMYRLADDSNVSREGYMEHSGWRAGVQGEYDITSSLSITGGLDYHFARTMRIYESSGDEDKKLDVDGAPGFTLGIGYAF